jgi:transketolase
VREAAATGAIVTVEDHNVRCGLGAMVTETLGDERLSCRLARLGVHRYGASGKPAALYREMGIDAEAVTAAMERLLET